jgi:hypothetical protein
MDDWLIFQYHLTRAQADSTLLREPPSGGYRPRWGRPAKGGRRRVSRPRRWLSWGKCVGRFPRQIQGAVNPEARCRAALGEATHPMLPRKSSSELVRCPYPKPTQVGR